MTAKLIGIALAFVAICAVFGWVYEKGVQSERTASLTKGVQLVKQRDKLDAQIRTATPADICNRLGGKWVLDNGGECD